MLYNIVSRAIPVPLVNGPSCSPTGAQHTRIRRYNYCPFPALGSTRTQSGGFCHSVCMRESLCQSTSLLMRVKSNLKMSLAMVVRISIHARLERRVYR